MLKSLAAADTEESLGTGIPGIGEDEVMEVFMASPSTGRPNRLISRLVFTYRTLAEFVRRILGNPSPVE